PGASLVTAVGDEFIDRFAGALKDIAVSLFGTNDKAALVVGIVLVALGIGAWIGAAARTRRWVPSAAFGAFGLLGAWAYSRTPFASTAVGILGGVLGAAAGLATLQGLLLLVPRPRPVPQPAPATDGVARSD